MFNSKRQAFSRMEQGLLKKVFLVMNLLIISSLSFAQKGNKALQITGEAIIPSAQKSVELGLSQKGLYGVTKNGLLAFAGSFSKYNLKNEDGAKEVKVRLVPFLVGYKQNIQWDLLTFAKKSIINR